MTATLNLLGAGKLGRTLARLWWSQQLAVPQQLFARTPPEDAVSFVGAGTACNLTQAAGKADIWLLACPDDQIPNAVQWLAQRHCVEAGTVVLHCSGSLTSDLLESLRSQGAWVASVHPAHAFAVPEKSLSTFAGSLCCAEGDASALAQLEPLFTGIGGLWQPLDSANKALYHAATVAASNYLVTTLHFAKSLAAQAGLDEHSTRALLTPLATHALDNVLHLPSTDALTGPISRGDAATLESHWRCLAGDSTAPALYHALATATLELARCQPQADATRLDTIASLLTRWSHSFNHDT